MEQLCKHTGFYLESLHVVALGAIPLDNDVSQVQDEHVSMVEAAPAHVHLDA